MYDGIWVGLGGEGKVGDMLSYAGDLSADVRGGNQLVVGLRRLARGVSGKIRLTNLVVWSSLPSFELALEKSHIEVTDRFPLVV